MNERYVTKNGVRFLCRIEKTKDGLKWRCGSCLRGIVFCLDTEDGVNLDLDMLFCRVCKADTVSPETA